MIQEQMTYSLDRNATQIFDEGGLTGVPHEELVELVDLACGNSRKLRRLAITKQFGEPNAHLRGHVMMMGRKFAVDRRCYIPDQYAEELVRRVIVDAPENAVIVEVGMGAAGFPLRSNWKGQT